MKKAFLILLITALFACSNESDTDTTKGNTDATDSTTIRQDNTINRDTVLRTDTAMGYR